MSAKATEYYTREQDTKGTARMVLFVLANHANEEGYCWPSISLIATKCNKSERAIQMALKALQEAGKIGIQYNHGRNTYQMKQKAIASKAGYFIGILKKFKAGEFTTGEAQKIQAKRAPKQTSSDDLKNKTAQIAEKNRKLILDEKATKVIEIINEAETRADLNKIAASIRGKFSGCTADVVMEKWSKRFKEIRT